MNWIMDWITTLSPETISLIVIALVGLPSSIFGWLYKRLDARHKFEMGHVTRELAEIKAMSARDETMGNLVNTAIDTVKTELRDVAAAMREASSAKREDDGELRKTLSSNTSAIINLRDVLEIQGNRFQSLETVTQAASDNVDSLETRLIDFLSELRTTVQEFTDSQVTHTESANERHKAILLKLDEIRTLLSPPPKPTKAMTPFPKSNEQTDDKDDKEEKFA